MQIEGPVEAKEVQTYVNGQLTTVRSYHLSAITECQALVER